MKQLFLILILLGFHLAQGQDQSLPHLRNGEQGVRLWVNNQPFTMLAGELHNSSTGSASYMRPIWQRMAMQNLNTVIAPVSWELIEAKEGVFDFSLVDSMIAGARKEDLKLVVIWFASWKNGKSTYVPEWVKNDSRRFPLVKDKNGKTKDILSPLAETSMQADARAFAELMKHIKAIDSAEQTVVMVQVENEIGVLDYAASFGNAPNSYYRDFSELANRAFNSPVPAKLISYLEKHREQLHPALKKVWADNGFRKSGTWEEVFGKGEKQSGEDWKTNFPWFTEELFMAWHYANYIGEIARQGKEHYALPMYVNAWLKQPRGNEPGQYPSGGPLPHVLDIWRAAAPSIDFIAPDIYIVEEFDWVCEEFSRSGNPLFIPETRVGPAGAARAFYAFGKYDAIGYAPFGIDGGGLLLSANPEDRSFEKVYGCLKSLAPFLQKYQGSDRMTGLFIDDKKNIDQVVMGDYTVTLRRQSLAGSMGLVGVQVNEEVREDDVAAGLMVIRLADNEFLVAGGIGSSLITITKSSSSKAENVGYASIDELTFPNGKEMHHRLNGDETTFGGPVIRQGEVKAFKIKMYTY